MSRNIMIFTLAKYIEKSHLALSIEIAKCFLDGDNVQLKLYNYC